MVPRDRPSRVRKELCRFNEETTDGRVITSEGTTWKNPMPLIDIDNSLVGSVTNIALDGNRLYGDLDFELDYVFCLTVDMALPKVTPEEGGVLLISGEVLSARISPDSAYPWKD